ncbi:hypothetical protein [Chondrinema litorale]|uniref:hypothetical protein n=1 Tax=Chondrinema litorale TaxID=2994555 RepID=UPI0025434371|nr:hypothetical protein [Chondrinema litorale]UZR94368.1 hypothetical protein OQ292_00870 [Chondrinema litorale]
MSKTSKYILPPGVSGFYKEGEDTPASIDVYQFRKACENLVEKTGYLLEAFYDFTLSETKSYHLAVVFKPDNSYILIFCNRYYPIIAFSKVLDIKNINQADFDLPENEFFDNEQLATFFKNNYEVLTCDYLSITVDADNEDDAVTVKRLTFYEFAEFSFWKPQTLGDIIFNDWG